MIKYLPNGYTIERADTPARYEALRALWCEVFGDSPDYVDHFYSSFGSDIEGYVASDSEGRVCSALTLFPCGSFEGRPVYVSYAVCTAPEQRGRRLAAGLVSYAKDKVLEKGGISIVSPAEPSLEDYYAGLGYEPCFFATRLARMTDEDDIYDYDIFDDFDSFGAEHNDDEPFEALIPGIELKAADTATYNRYREAFLTGRPHIELSDDMLKLAESECEADGGLFVINRGDAICAVTTAAKGSLVMSEFILSPALEELSLEIDEEIAVAAAEQLEAFEVIYSKPGAGICQAMAAGIETRIDDEPPEGPGYVYSEAYYGFPIE